MPKSQGLTRLLNTFASYKGADRARSRPCKPARTRMSRRVGPSLLPPVPSDPGDRVRPYRLVLGRYGQMTDFNLSPYCNLAYPLGCCRLRLPVADPQLLAKDGPWTLISSGLRDTLSFSPRLMSGDRMGFSSFDPFTLHAGDARNLRKLLDRLTEPNTPPLSCTITSPPYGSIKNYGSPDQIGWGQPYDEYLVEMRRIFRTLYQYTRTDGSMWLIADTLRADDKLSADLPQRMEPLPFQLAEEAADAGWILREVLIWQKQKTSPWSSGRRLRNVFEYVLLFAKSSSYKFYSDRLRDPENLEEWWVKWPERYHPVGKAPTNVWEIRSPARVLAWNRCAARLPAAPRPGGTPDPSLH